MPRGWHLTQGGWFCRQNLEQRDLRRHQIGLLPRSVRGRRREGAVLASPSARGEPLLYLLPSWTHLWHCEHSLFGCVALLPSLWAGLRFF